MFCTPNQYGGKTVTLTALLAQHITNNYWDEYTGPRLSHKKNINVALGGRTAQNVRDLITDKLLGEYGQRGTGTIPPDCFDGEDSITYASSGIKHQIDYFDIKRKDEDGEVIGRARLFCFSYGSGWKKMAGYTIDVVACDEEPDDWNIYEELKARTNATKGLMYFSMTPQLGFTQLYKEFSESKDPSLHRLITADIVDCTHLTPEDIEEAIKDWEKSPWVQARLHGMPVGGEGLIFPIDDAMISTTTLPDRPLRWIIGLDFPHTTGYFAAAKLAYDTVEERIYVTELYKESGRDPHHYAEQVLDMGGDAIPCAWPHDANRALDGGGTIAAMYEDLGLWMLHESSRMEGIDHGLSHAIIPAIQEISGRMIHDRFKVLLPQGQLFLDEKRDYRLKDGKVKRNQDDHAIDAVIKACMMVRYAESQEEEALNARKLHSLTAEPNFYEDF